MDEPRDYRDIIAYEQGGEGRHHHRGKSSESVLDKEKILDALPLGPGQTVLDAGCGNGYMAKEFLRRVGPAGRVYALDPDEAAIDRLRRETESDGLIALAADITAPTGLPGGAFDLVYLCTVVHGFSPEQFAGFAAEIDRLLAPGGFLAVVEIVKRESPFGPPLARRLSPEELQARLALAPEPVVELGKYFYLQIFRAPPTAETGNPGG
ncbi:MAG TPA: class I SAM-dependent methyltransferase [bacterium]|nr:class I SAM-dependent methyltransferase [bacterium]HPJ72003.1 class I SAM-dependent methyltransferase [bacterium]HPQ66455.1 class I SAM-dependent methyltransferase [bacterium]